MARKIKKNSLANKLLSYSAVAGAFVAAGSEAEAQVIKTDLIPDVILSGAVNQMYYIDMNNDALDDFEITQDGYVYTTTSSTFQYFYVGIMKSNPNFGIAGSNSASAWPLDAGSAIDTLMSFNVQSGAYNLAYMSSNFAGLGDQYIGVKFKIGSETKYGWILVNVSPMSDSISIKAFGYESTASGVKAGDTTGVFISNLQVNNINYNSANAEFPPSATGTAFYVVQLANDPAPSAQEVADETGASGATLVAFGDIPVTAGVPAVINLTALSPLTNYKIYVVQTDTVDILSALNTAPFSTTQVGISEMENLSFNVFPNPANKLLNIESLNGGLLSIFDIEGREVMQLTIAAGRASIDITDITPGIYSLKLSGRESVLVKTISIQ